jgi:hypothetical protein
MSQFDAVFQEVAGVTAQIRHCLEEAEAKVELLNHLVPALAATGLITRSVWLGPSFEREDDEATEPHDSGQVVQAAFLLPDGFGVCLWNAEEYARLRRSGEGLEASARGRFLPFSRCSSAEKAFLNVAAQPLMEELADAARVARSQLDEGEDLEMTQFFETDEAHGRRGE